jgi:hypothetical protein
MPCLVFFLGITSHIMTPCTGFPFFWFFLKFLCPHLKSRSNSRCPPCVLGWWGPQVWVGLWGSTPSGHLQVFSPKIFEVQFM